MLGSKCLFSFKGHGPLYQACSHTFGAFQIRRNLLGCSVLSLYIAIHCQIQFFIQVDNFNSNNTMSSFWFIKIQAASENGAMVYYPLPHPPPPNPLGQSTPWQKDLLNQIVLLGTFFLSKLLIICIINYCICRIKQYSGGNCLNKTQSFFYSLLSESGHKKLKSTIQRSTETGMAAEMRKMVRQPSRESTDGSINSYSSEGK